MIDDVTPDFNLEGQEVGSYAKRLHDEDSGWTHYTIQKALNMGKFPGHIHRLQALFDGDQFQIGTIFNFTGASVKSTGILKDELFVHIKKR